MVELARLNVMPWDLERLTVQQFNAFCAAIESARKTSD